MNLAAALAEKKIHTLLVDLDPQANAPNAFGVEKQAGRSLYGPLRGEGSAFKMSTPLGAEGWLEEAGIFSKRAVFTGKSRV